MCARVRYEQLEFETYFGVEEKEDVVLNFPLTKKKQPIIYNNFGLLSFMPHLFDFFFRQKKEPQQIVCGAGPHHGCDKNWENFLAEYAQMIVLLL